MGEGGGRGSRGITRMQHLLRQVKLLLLLQSIPVKLCLQLKLRLRLSRAELS